MKAILITVLFLFSSGALASQKLKFGDTIKVSKVVMNKEILLVNLPSLYQNQKKIKVKKSSWTQSLREKLRGSTGIYSLATGKVML